MEGTAYLILAVATIAIAWVLSVVAFWKGPGPEEEEHADQNGSNRAAANGDSKSRKHSTSGDGKKGAKQGKVKSNQNQTKEKEKFAHSWLASTLRGHSGEVIGMDLSPNNKFLATCAVDRTVYVWFTKNFADKDHKSIRVNIPFDHANFIRWSPDSKAFIVSRQEEKILEVYKLGRKPDNSVGNITSALQWHQGTTTRLDYIGLGIACNGKFIMSCTKDGSIVLREPKGQVLKKFLSPFKQTTEAKVSPCGRYIGIVGGNEVAVFEVSMAPATGEFQDCALKWKVKTGADVASHAFSTDSSKLALVCSDGVWELYDTTGSRVNVETKGRIEGGTSAGSKPLVALSGDGRVVLIGAQNDALLFSAFSGNLLDKISNVHKGGVKCVEFSADAKYFLTAGGNVIHVFNNVSWYKETIKSLRNQLQDSSITGSMRNRLTSELSSFENEVKTKGIATAV